MNRKIRTAGTSVVELPRRCRADNASAPRSTAGEVTPFPLVRRSDDPEAVARALAPLGLYGAGIAILDIVAEKGFAIKARSPNPSDELQELLVWQAEVFRARDRLLGRECLPNTA